MNRNLKFAVRAGVCLVAALAAISAKGQQFPQPSTGVPWPAGDRLGRSLPLAADAGNPKADRFVGIFYFLWHDELARQRAQGDGPHDIRKILQHDPHALSKPDSPLWGGPGAAHYWGEPLYGYYRSDDPWVLRRHAHVLSDAGVDVLIFDATNAVTYPQAYLKLCEVFQQVREGEGSSPQFAFMVNTKAGETAQRIYRDLYEPKKFPELWFHWQGKPLLICDPEQASPELQKFFTLRRAHWPFTMVDTHLAWHWEATYPQPFGYVDDPTVPEQVNVSVAQNLRRSDGQVTNMSDGDARGRSFHAGKIDDSPDAINHGYNFQEQWRRALELDPPFVMITGWNEWIAGRFSRPGKPIVFVDQYDQEYSRDIEFAKHGHLDNYYYQMVANIRRYKGVAKLPTAMPQQETDANIDINAGLEQWQHVRHEFPDHRQETLPRDHPGVGGTHYKNHSGRNDLVHCKVATDAEFVYFYLRADSTLQPSDAPENLWLLIDTDGKHSTGWEGYDLIVARERDATGNYWVEEHVSYWQWKRKAPVTLRQEGAELQIAVPRNFFSAVGTEACNFDFKWADNIQRPGDIQDFYLSGDVAPNGRFNYPYRED